MEKAKLCNRIANGMERLSGFTGKRQLHLYEHIDISKEIEVIAAVESYSPAREILSGH